MFAKFLSFLLILSSLSTYSLEIDEKLTLRILSLSDSKKTALINRGLEDGLVVGDHAKFFLTTGVIARGVVVKASPSRSIWSLYRIVDLEEIEKNKVMNLKIASPVKITEDPSKSLVQVNSGKGTDRIAVATGDTEGSEMSSMSEEDTSELNALSENDSLKEEAPTVASTSTTSKSFEIWALANLTSMSGTFDDGTTSTSTSQSSLDFSIGAEKFFPTSKSFFKNVSLFAFITKRSSTSGADIQSTMDWTEFGGGINYYFYNTPFQRNRFAFFGTLSAGIGSAEYTTEVAEGSSVPSSLGNSLSGSSSLLSIGVGSRYMFSGNLSMLGVFDYFSSSTSFDSDNGDTSVLSVSGPRLRVGLAYRF